jgi:chromosome segregation ATPase
MRKSLDYIPGIALFLAGVAAGIVTARRTPQQAGPLGEQPLGGGTAPGPTATQELERSVQNLASRLAAQETAAATRFGQLEARLEEQAARLAAVPSTSQIVSAMEQLLSKTMASLDDRLTTQAHSIEVLKTTVSQTDSLLERVLESLDSLQASSEASDQPDDALFRRAV